MSEQFEPGHEVPVTGQSFPGKEGDMPHPTPKFDKIPTADGGEKLYQAAGKLKDKKAIITGGDSGIGRASAILFAMEGADTLIAYLPDEEDDAQETKKRVEDYGRKCYLLATDVTDKANCKKVVDEALEKLGGIDILFNNAAYQMMVENIKDLSEDQWLHTFNTNIHPFFFLSKYALPPHEAGRDHYQPMRASTLTWDDRALLDYTSTKGAHRIVYSRFEQPEAQKNFTSPMGRPAQPSEIATCVVFLASTDSSALSGQVIHCNGGVIVNG
ncbi:glucose and ribitol dehydrogenase [Verticillium alfalfae VaMs.102]|uniref:Glucose and ribitol dehydrogenase n=1 Tax=Verticillium alfalfae (strain VaMs.102 / ATCC MYA-4576 / FGSC 10136) TaxID=526221 RepID=C9SMA2_VERA1|nr:glucose and ribitol dehydrogenase [Verticillium alfalfae VaMs.102]EEY19917.1 glucose and ribitol dehydrogenase [Verticillium alfalfae VaMs.102]